MGEDKPFETETSWYHWRNKHWGTKWDFGKTEYTADEECDWQVDEEGYGLVHLRFETAWSPPIGLYEALNALDMTVEAYFFEPGVSFCGQWSNPVEGIIDEVIEIDNPAIYLILYNRYSIQKNFTRRYNTIYIVEVAPLLWDGD